MSPNLHSNANPGAVIDSLGISDLECVLSKKPLGQYGGRRTRTFKRFSTRRISSATCKRTLAATFGRYLSKSTPEASLTNLDSDVSGRLRCLRSLSEMLTTRTQLCIPKVGVL